MPFKEGFLRTHQCLATSFYPSSLSQHRNEAKNMIKNLCMISVAIAVTGAILYYGGRQSIDLLIHPDWHFVLPVGLALFVTYGAAGIRWGIIVNSIHRHRVSSYVNYVSYHIMAIFSSSFLSFLGAALLAKPAILRIKTGTTIQSGVYSVILERVVDMMLVGFGIIPGICFFLGFLNKSASLFLFFAVVGLAVFVSILLYKPIIKALIGTHNFLLAFYFFLLKALFGKDSSKRDFNKKEKLETVPIGRSLVIAIVALSTLRYFSILGMLYFVVEMYQLQISFFQILIGVPLVQMSTFIAVVPGGFGIMEASWLGVLTFFRTPASDITVFIVAQRLWITVFSALILTCISVSNAIFRKRSYT